MALTATAIAGAVSANAIQAAPVALVKTISAVAVAKGAAATTSTLTLVKGALKLMAWTKMKTAIVVGVGVLLVAGTTTMTIHEIRKLKNMNQFVISAGDVSAAPIVFRTGSTEAIVDVHFWNAKAAEFGKFWQNHLDKQVQILVGTKLIAEPVLHGAMTGHGIQLHFATHEEAKTVADLLTKR